MRHEHLGVDAVTERQSLKELIEQLIRLAVVLVADLAIESVKLIELLGLMVSSRHEEVVREAHLPSQHADDDLDREGASINEVTVE